MKRFFALLALISITGCGSNSQNSTSPISFSEFNQNCIDGKISGEYIIELSDKSFQVITAASKKSLFKKLNSQTFQQNLNRKGISVTNIDFNFKVPSINQSINNDGNEQTDFTNTSSEAPLLLNADFLWKQGFYGAGAVTAVIDSGYDKDHPLLSGSVAENTLELGNDEDQNGFINDRFGWNFITDTPLLNDPGEHGTYVGSAIAARHTDRFKFSIAPESKIVPIAGLEPASDSETEATGDSNSIISALDYAIKRNVDFINASWGGQVCSEFIREKIKEATDKGIVFVTSAGNEGLDLDKNVTFPGSLTLPLVLTVGALNQTGGVERNSNFGQIVDFFALGESAVVASPQNTLSSVTGTSIAAPYITGALALLKSAFPQASNKALVEALEDSKNISKVPDLEDAFLFLKDR